MPDDPREGGTAMTDHLFPRDAACATADPETFYPVGTQGTAYERSVADARAICSGCPVRTKCLSYALAREMAEPRPEEAAHGVWGGMTAPERLALIRQWSREQREREHLRSPRRPAHVTAGR